jgi:hypothetical protein
MIDSSCEVEMLAVAGTANTGASRAGVFRDFKAARAAAEIAGQPYPDNLSATRVKNLSGAEIAK